MPKKPRIVLLHATPVAVAPVETSFANRWPDAELVNLLDDSLSADRARTRELTPEMVDRFLELGRYANRLGADGILVTCSAFGPAIEQMARDLPIPVLKPNEAMFRAALATGSKIGMLATFAPSVLTMTEEFDEFVQAAEADATLRTVVADGAMDALRSGDAETHNSRVAACAHELDDCDAIMLAHFSTSRAMSLVKSVVQIPVLAAPDAAVDQLKGRILGPA
ncbi:MAG TPA: aspartate/glutamate racemase family protein [Hyphomicrobiaceae bacterium]|nr:aspartate/glutamate racemase family protein [Hyphomicrobiaceae bacterium]